VNKPCDCCGYPAKLTTHEGHALCRVCSSTYLGYAVLFPSQCDGRLYRSIGWITNAILDALNAKENPK
jgi:hypothetical protein